MSARELVRPGNKRTEVGVIPEDWQEVVLRDKTLKVGSGITPTGGSRVYKQFGRPFVRSQNVGWGALILDDLAYIDDTTHRSFETTEIKLNDVLLNITGASIGRNAVADARVATGNVNQHVCIIRPKDNELDPRFLNHFLLSSKGQSQIDSFQAGGNRQGLNFRQIKSFRLAAPAQIQEQRAIAAALSDVDTLIGSLEALIAKKRDMKQAAMHQLLTGKIRLPGFMGEWQVKPIESFSAFITKGATPTTYGFNWEDDGIIFLRSECVSDDGLDLAQSMFVSTAAHAALIRGEVRSGDILITITGNVGRVVHLQPDFGIANINQHIARIRVNAPSVLPDYVYHWLSQPAVRAYYTSITTGQAYPQISLKQVRDTQVQLPSLAEQSGIAAVLSDMGAEIAAFEGKCDKIRALKAGMMQELLTGRIRLV